MGFNAIAYPLRIMIFYLFRFLGKCCDRKCTFNKKISKCKSQEDYEKKYMGVEFSLDWRYAQVIDSLYFLIITEIS